MLEKYTPEALKLSDGAVEKILSLSKEERDSAINLRVFVTGGGCSGFQYEISLEDHISQDDLVLTKNQAKVVIDPISLGFLSGAVIDYEEELIGSKFVVNNPNATSSCGCGTSFSL